MWPRPPTPMATAVEPGTSLGSDRRMAWYGVRPASVSGAAATGSRSPSGTTRRADGTRRYGAMPPSRPRPPGRAGGGRVDAVVLGALAAADAVPAAPRAVHGDGLADLEAGDAGAEGVDPAGVLVAERERRLVRHQSGRELVEQVEVGVADAGAADLDDDLAGTRIGLRDVAQLRVVLPGGELQGTHDRLQPIRRCSRLAWISSTMRPVGPGSAVTDGGQARCRRRGPGRRIVPVVRQAERVAVQPGELDRRPPRARRARRARARRRPSDRPSTRARWPRSPGRCARRRGPAPASGGSTPCCAGRSSGGWPGGSRRGGC